MKNFINYYYSLDSSELRLVDENYIFYASNQKFLLCKIELNVINNLKFILKSMHDHSSFHTVVYNRNKEIVTFDGINYYILFKINIKHNRYIKISDIFNLYYGGNFQFDKLVNTFNWIKLWSDKIDYLEYYINLKDNMSDEIRCVFNYFVGMGENAINCLTGIFENSKIDDSDKLSFVHKRLSYKYTMYDLYNPLNLVVDHISRDISEYLKSIFFDGVYQNVDIEKIILNLNFSEFGYKLLFARMLFPTFFFDILDNYELHGFSSKEILNMFNKTVEYEKYVFYIYKTIKKTRNINIPRIPWISV